MIKQHVPNHIPKVRIDNIDCIVSHRLKTMRILRGHNQKEMGRAVNVSVQQIQKYENGINRISSGKLYNFAKFLNTPVDYFFTFNNSSSEEIGYTGLQSNSSLALDKETLSLIKAFIGIKNEQTRKKILNLVKVMV